MIPPLMPLPCGCIVSTDEPPPHDANVSVIGCRWCGAAFLRDEYHKWLGSDDWYVWMIAPGPPMVSIAGRVVQVDGRCQCGAPTVGARHLRDGEFEVLRN